MINKNKKAKGKRKNMKKHPSKDIDQKQKKNTSTKCDQEEAYDFTISKNNGNSGKKRGLHTLILAEQDCSVWRYRVSLDVGQTWCALLHELFRDSALTVDDNVNHDAQAPRV
jgi:hypothetical protein